MNIAKEDKLKNNILEEIKKREKIIKKTYEKLKKQTVNVTDTNSILYDYQNYYNLRRIEIETQINALEVILKHLDNLKTDNREKIKEDKKPVSNEIKKLYKKLDSIPK